MAKFKNKIAVAALAIFEAHKQIEEVYMTSDGQGFTDDHKANDHSRYLADKSVKSFKRGFEDSYKDEEASTDAKDATLHKVDEGERAELAAKYEKLYGAKPNHNTGIEKLKAKIAEKEAELAKQGDQPQV